MKGEPHFHPREEGGRRRRKEDGEDSDGEDKEGETEGKADEAEERDRTRDQGDARWSPSRSRRTSRLSPFPFPALALVSGIPPCLGRSLRR